MPGNDAVLRGIIMDFMELLSRAGITRAELARRLNVSESSVYRWSNDLRKSNIPGYATAYLELLVEFNRVRP